MKRFLSWSAWVVIGLSLIFLFQNYLHEGVPYTHDGENHLARFANYKIALREGQLPPRWAPNLMSNYGYPVFNFNYPLANILSIPGSFLNLNYEMTFKLLMIGFVMFGACGVFLWLKRVLPNSSRWAQIIAISSWVSATYLVNLINFRGNIGEVMAYGLFPWMLWVIEQTRDGKRFSLLSLSFWSLLTAMFLLAHNVTAVFAAPILIVYTAVRLRTRHQFVIWLGSIAWGILLSLWFWLPALAEKSYTVVSSAKVANQFATHFPTLNQLIFQPLSFGYSYPGPIDSLSFWLGATTIAGLIIFIGLLFQKRSPSVSKSTRLLLFTLFCLSLLIIFFETIYSAVIWQLMPFVRLIQFPWRISIFLPTLMVPIVAFGWQNGRLVGKIVLTISLCVTLLASYRVEAADYIHKANIDYEAFGQSTSTENENLTPEIHFENIADWDDRVAIIAGEGEIAVSEWRGSNRSYELLANSHVTVVEPTMVFPGWETHAIDQENGERRRLDYINSDQIAGRLSYELEPGSYYISTKFTQHTWPRMIGNLISLVAMTAVLSIWFVWFKQYVTEKKS